MRQLACALFAPPQQRTLETTPRSRRAATRRASDRQGDRGAVTKHVGILTAPDRMIHAIEGAAVGEVPLGPWWRRHMAAAFSFPGVQS